MPTIFNMKGAYVMDSMNLVKDITGNLADSANINAVFGESRVIGNKTIIPIAMMGIGFGAGGGETKKTEEGEAPIQQGGGGGGGGKAKPLAVLEVTEAETRLIPIIDMTRVIMGGLCLAGMTTWMIIKLIGRKKR